jgi:hypothetical protein
VTLLLAVIAVVATFVGFWIALRRGLRAAQEERRDDDA